MLKANLTAAVALFSLYAFYLPVQSFYLGAQRVYQPSKSSRSFQPKWRMAVEPTLSAKQLKKELLEAVQGTKRGVVMDDAKNAEIRGLIEKLCKLNPTPNAANSPLVNGRWRLQWTTEKEVLFIAKNGVFGLAATNIVQDIDTVGNSLQNLIELENDSFFSVKSTCVPKENSDRIEFKFVSASLKYKMLKVPLPPVGKGWFANIYLDEDIRINSDSRGDVQITTRC
mmetsp:Transcript_4231/g.6317  ORF Transcript_4231/g.6317 Transcript_4231/m.6317 type:complete len:226 (-) Transcript_4231:152-829(-)|eukprot:CAMPEP_0113942958 /NCGR_PEP_ID=MMETSP1339-20121228/14980_1 /TAXON_ID=94617 /ORGANISM="Fibrocapsa japonica" /LENGTH=225 /DNA_ID=CAMNT_0000947657 /DNA_START=41 /DNA_END=718 /DNA_ORIENTATION=- /assembly_acc=CAM_ASM_000762